MSFSSGFVGGAKVGASWVDGYKESRDRDIENELFKYASNMEQEGAGIEQRNAEFGDQVTLFKNSSANDIGNMLVERMVMGGGKVSDDTYRVAFDVGNLLFDANKKGVKLDQDTQMFNAKKQKAQSVLGKMSQLNKMNSEKEAKSKQWSKDNPKGAEFVAIRNGALGQLGLDGKKSLSTSDTNKVVAFIQGIHGGKYDSFMVKPRNHNNTGEPAATLDGEVEVKKKSYLDLM